MDHGEIVLVTRVTTNNQGNEALSRAWSRLLLEAVPSARVSPVERVHPYLKRYTLHAVDGADPIRAFDALAGRLAGLADGTPPDTSMSEIRLSGMDDEVRLSGLRNRLQVGRRLSALGRGRGAYAARAARFAAAQLVVVNPAGEFHPSSTDLALRYLLDVRAAQLVGTPTALVNLTLEVRDPVVLRLVAHVADHSALVHLRDDESRDRLRAAGSDRDVLVTPDAALLTEAPPAPEHTHGLAVSMNVPQAARAGLTDTWRGLIANLASDGLDPVLVSNEWPLDAPTILDLESTLGCRSALKGLPSREYAEALGRFDAVVSSRFHTLVLALCAGTAVVPVEVETIKLSGFFRQLGLGDSVVDLATQGPERVRASLDAVRADRAAVVAAQQAAVATARAQIRDAVIPVVRRMVTT